MRVRLCIVMLCVSMILSGCLDTTGNMPRVEVWLESPLPGGGDISIPLGSSLPIYGHVRQNFGSTLRQAYLMNRDTPLAVLTLTPEGENLYSVYGVWTPITEGEYRLKIRAEINPWSRFDSKTVKVIVTYHPMLFVTPTDTVAATLPSIEPATFTPTDTLTAQPPATQTPTATPIPTSLPTVTPSPTPWPAVQADFWADRASLIKGECTLLHWEVKHAISVLLNNKNVEPSGSKKVCPEETSGYDLLAKAPSGDVLRELTITVALPQDTTPPPVPTPLQPGSTDHQNHPLSPCIPLQWQEVSDPIGVVYSLQLEKMVSNQWVKMAEWHNLATTNQNIGNFCTSGFHYRWRVRAKDGAGNWSNWSPWFYFATPIL